MTRRQRQITQIGRKCKRLGITHQKIADEANPPVSRPMVTLVFLNRAVSANVIGAALRLIAKAENGQNEPAPDPQGLVRDESIH